MTPPRPVRGEPAGTVVNTPYVDELPAAPDGPDTVPDEPTVPEPGGGPPEAA